MQHSWRLQKEIYFDVNVGVVMSPNGLKSKGALRAICYSAVRKQYTLAIRQITRAALPYIYKNDWLQMSQNSMQTTCPVLVHKPVKYDVNTICDVEIFVVQLTH